MDIASNKSLTIDDIIVAEPNPDDLVEPQKWFDSPGLLELEIGSGKGGFLLRRAQANPDRRLIGIEWANKFYKYAADRMARWNVRNVRMIRMDAEQFVKRNLPDACLASLFVFHPDPWHKRKHNKRRLIQTPFADHVARVLVPDGIWAIQTDHLDYFEQIREVVPVHPRFEEIPFDETGVYAESEQIETNFEIKYRREGRAIYKLAARKRNR